MNESSTNFDLTNEQKEKMIDFGYYETLKQLRTKFNLSQHNMYLVNEHLDYNDHSYTYNVGFLPYV